IGSNGQNIYVIIKLAPLQKLFRNRIKEIPLLNIYLIANYVNLSPIAFVPTDDQNPNHSGRVSTMPINVELKTSPIMYLYERKHTSTIPIKTTANPVYDVATVPLNKFGFIKDFYFVIVRKDDHLANKIDQFVDELIEMEILMIGQNASEQQPKILSL